MSSACDPLFVSACVLTALLAASGRDSPWLWEAAQAGKPPRGLPWAVVVALAIMSSGFAMTHAWLLADAFSPGPDQGMSLVLNGILG
jgi:hypothetical protein